MEISCRVLVHFSICFLFLSLSAADKLSSGQKAPIYASGAGGLSLPLPKENSPKPQPKPAGQPQPQGDVQQEETETYKTVGDKFIRVVMGSVGYSSPEGLPVLIKYTADENGNRASFTIGKPGSGGSSGSSGGKGGAGSSSKGGSGAGSKAGSGGGKEGKGDAYLPPNQMNKGNGGDKGGKMYLPPK